MKFTWVILMFLLLLLAHERRKRQSAVSRIIQRKHIKKERDEMLELAKRMIGTECIVYTISGSSVSGVVEEVDEGGLVLADKGNRSILNLEYVVRIQEYPRNKNGKKKAVVIG